MFFVLFVIWHHESQIEFPPTGFTGSWRRERRSDIDLLLEDTIEVICEVRPDADPASMNARTRIEELGLSSLELTEVIMEMEDRHDIEVDIGTVEASKSLSTIGDIVNALDVIIKAKD